RLSVRVAAARIVIEMLAAVPSPCRHVDAAAKGDAIVDHDDFLVMRRGKRMGAIQLEGNALVPFPAEDGEKSGAAEQRLDGARIPAQQSDLKVWRAVGEPENEIAEFLRPLACVITETDAGIEIPSDQIDAVPRLQHGLARHDEIISRIDNERKALRRLRPPVVYLALQKCRCHERLRFILLSMQQLSCRLIRRCQDGERASPPYDGRRPQREAIFAQMPDADRKRVWCQGAGRALRLRPPPARP